MVKGREQPRNVRLLQRNSINKKCSSPCRTWAANRPIKTKADAQGYWETAIATPKASFTPQTLTISDGTPIKINDILIGEVWLCSGQSNMEMPLRGFDRCPIFDSNNFLADAPNHPAIRAVTLAHAKILELHTLQTDAIVFIL